MEEYKDYEEIDDENEIINDEDKKLLKDNDNFVIDEDEDTNYDEVLTLTEYSSGDIASNNPGITAEYNSIDIVTVDKKNQLLAKNFVQKITKFITDFKDIDLSDEHVKYLKIVGEFQLSNLADLLGMIEINKQMMNNIILRVNSVQAEDYAMIATYNSLLNQHLKLLKTTQEAYRNIPSIIKKMRTEVMCNQELGDVEGNQNEVITENSGITQFNNQKALLKKLREDYDKK